MRDLIERHGGEVIDEFYLPMQPPAGELQQLVQRVKTLRPDVVFSTLVGRNICEFCTHYADAGIDPADIPIASHNITEAELLEVGRPECAGHVTAAPYFSSITTPANREFVRAFRQRFGVNAAISQYAASSYAALRMFGMTLERAGEVDTQRLMSCARGLEMEAPHGRVVIDTDNNHTWLTPRVGVWNGVDEFELVWESGEMVQPDPWLVSYGGVEDVPDAAYAPS
jgi:branched-chain amino acid transport system substrate-binding protein